MDRERFDDLARRLATARTRRKVMRLGAGALLGITSLSAAGLGRDLAVVEAKKKKVKKTTICHDGRTIKVATKTLKSHLAHGDTIGFTNCSGGRCCSPSSPTCCPATTQDPGGSCAPKDQTCCKSEEGGSSCPKEFPKCCLITLGEGCCELGQDCCNTSEDCTAPQVCDDFGCCVTESELQAASMSGARRVRESRRQR